VREALARLESTGLVIRTALRGYTVADPLSLDQLAELFAARIVVETAAVSGLFPVREGLVPALRRAHERHVAAAKKVMAAAGKGPRSLDLSTVRAYYDADHAFHLVLLENCGNRYLLNMAQSLSPHLHRLRQEYRAGQSDVDLATQEHARILAAVEAGDRDAAITAMHDHLAAVRARALTNTQEHVELRGVFGGRSGA
jgi:DNA-binding GntR family transcriptional regulator